MKYFEHEILGIDGSAAKFVGYCLENSEEIVPDRVLIDACKKAGVSVEAHLFPNGGHGLSLGTAETAWQGVNGIEPSMQIWTQLAVAWMRRTFAR